MAVVKVGIASKIIMLYVLVLLKSVLLTKVNTSVRPDKPSVVFFVTMLEFEKEAYS